MYDLLTPTCLQKSLYHFIFPPEASKTSDFSTFLPTRGMIFGIIATLIGHGSIVL